MDHGHPNFLQQAFLWNSWNVDVTHRTLHRVTHTPDQETQVDLVFLLAQTGLSFSIALVASRTAWSRLGIVPSNSQRLDGPTCFRRVLRVTPTTWDLAGEIRLPSEESVVSLGRSPTRTPRMVLVRWSAFQPTSVMMSYYNAGWSHPKTSPILSSGPGWFITM